MPVLRSLFVVTCLVPTVLLRLETPGCCLRWLQLPVNRVSSKPGPLVNCTELCFCLYVYVYVHVCWSSCVWSGFLVPPVVEWVWNNSLALL